ncbi:MAG: phosphatidate cytidylyltransferase [Treponema sp.]|jgi:phosphatidate cytidylyltransferase|nr:phosphatidate cytidylyltransferase [Treponema sp.]
MSKLAERLLVFFIGIPAVFALVLLLPFYRHLPLNIVVILFSAIGAVEFSAMLEKKHIHISKAEAFILGALLPAAATLNVSFGFPHWLIPLMLMTGALWALLSHVFTGPQNVDTVVYRLAVCFCVMCYPGFFMYWMVQMHIWENSGAIVFLFLLITFFNDSTAWLFGTLFGANNRGIITVSPNKSIAGYIGGLIGSVVISAGAVLLIPSVFSISESPVSALLPKAIILGVFTGVFASLGDLAESAIKRSCNVKDSGNLMLGRGGILDSIDSIAAAAPVFFMLYNVFFYSFR